MDIRETNISEIDVLNTLWWIWCNEHLSKEVINKLKDRSFKFQPLQKKNILLILQVLLVIGRLL